MRMPFSVVMTARTSSLLLAVCSGLALTGNVPVARAEQSGTARAEATSLAGTPLSIPRLPNAGKLTSDLEAAQKTLAANPNDPEAVIWVGRRYGYLWRFQDAIATFSRGIERWPDNAKFYRHRGHRYITIRQFAKAEADPTTPPLRRRDTGWATTTS